MTNREMNKLAKKFNEVFGCCCDYEEMQDVMIDYCLDNYANEEDDICTPDVGGEECWRRFIEKIVNDDE